MTDAETIADLRRQLAERDADIEALKLSIEQDEAARADMLRRLLADEAPTQARSW